MSYSKRQKAHWNVGKGCKGMRKAKEKAYTEAEIEEQLATDDPSFRYRSSRRKKNMKAHLEYTIEWYKQAITRYVNRNDHDRYASYLRHGLKLAEKRLAEFQSVHKT